MMRSAAALVGLVAAAPLLAGTTYQTGGFTSFIQDLDANDGVNLFEELEGEYRATFTIDPAELNFASSVQSQGGSRTAYSGVVLDSLSLFLPSGERVVVGTPISGFLVLWDRAGFGAGQHILSLDFELDEDGFNTVSIDFSANFGTPAYGNLFNVGTPQPNTPLDGVIPLFENGFFGTYSLAGITIDADVPYLPGRGRYFGDAEFLVPAPGAASGLACSLLLLSARRRRETRRDRSPLRAR